MKAMAVTCPGLPGTAGSPYGPESDGAGGGVAVGVGAMITPMFSKNFIAVCGHPVGAHPLPRGGGHLLALSQKPDAPADIA